MQEAAWPIELLEHWTFWAVLVHDAFKVAQDSFQHFARLII